MNKELFETQWKLLANNKNLTAGMFISRAIFIAMSAKNKNNAPREDIIIALLQKYFSPVSNTNKLTNGAVEYGAITWTKRSLQYHKPTHILGLPWERFLTEEEYKEYLSYLKNINTEKMNRKYVYYFTVQDGLTPEQQGVQAGHALFVLGNRLHKDVAPDHIYFQWIGVKTDKDLEEIATKLKKYKFETFREPDLGNRLTTIAFHPILWNKREDFLEYDLLTHGLSGNVG